MLGELYAWAYRRVDPQLLVDRIESELLPDVDVLDFDTNCAIEFGRLRGELLKRGIVVSRSDLLIAAIARFHDLTLVTHNTRDFQHIRGLRLEDWL